MTPDIRMFKSKPTIEGAGVQLKRAFGYQEVPLLDPFLLLDDFGSSDPRDYILGFPWHPHRGIETVTYVLTGSVKHEDSLGNKGTIASGDVQWMTAGSGIIHQEMPQQFEGRMRGFQLWVNLPAAHKMMDPRYRDVRKEQIPEIQYDDGISMKIISGKVADTIGPVKDLMVDVVYLDVSISSGMKMRYNVAKDHKAFIYVIVGGGYTTGATDRRIGQENLVIFSKANAIDLEAGSEGMRFLLVAGKPLNEPVAWYGPIVMNSQQELDLAFKEYREGTFIKHGSRK
ncbi:MAG: pirin family protein [candidate division WOR-3 bacterium]|nr:MAG: pirin family protein [candidate division WOR-3 bacterium]